MKKYAEYEAMMMKMVRRGLQTQLEAIDKCMAYLQAMVDFDVLPEDRLQDEIRIAARKILDIK